VREAQIVLLAVPAQTTYDVGTHLIPFVSPGATLLTCAKGIAQDSGLLMTDIVQKLWTQGPYGILSGPSFATEVARGLPTAVVIACPKAEDAQMCASALASPTFRIYHSVDLTGVALGGALKNVLAIAAGIVHGRDLGENARSALITRGFAEMTRFARACGAHSNTLMGLSGLGDVILSCSSTQSRNFSLGQHLGRGSMSKDSSLYLAEGTYTAPILLKKAQALGVDMPIVAAVVAILSQEASLDSVIDDLLGRPLGPETL
jgi:glycerol-3-phosphate dehydrogenase (NAD(P)+)